jgi:hypothetical protein
MNYWIRQKLSKQQARGCSNRIFWIHSCFMELPRLPLDCICCSALKSKQYIEHVLVKQAALTHRVPSQVKHRSNHFEYSPCTREPITQTPKYCQIHKSETKPTNFAGIRTASMSAKSGTPILSTADIHYSNDRNFRRSELD